MLLRCEDLTIGYEGAPVLEGLNFGVSSGDYLYIVGENGSGKSTLMKTILGLIPPLSGRVVTGDGLKRQEIGYLPQQTAAQKDFPALAAAREISRWTLFGVEMSTASTSGQATRCRSYP